MEHRSQEKMDKQLDIRIMKKLIYILVALAIFSSCTQQESELAALEPDPLVEGLDSIATAFFNETRYPGIVVSVGHKGELLYSMGFGYSDLENDVPADPSKSKFRVGSVAKAFTAGAIGKLVEEGKLDLDAPIQQYVPEFPEKSYPISTRQVAGHIAGIRHYNGNEMMSSMHYQDVMSGLDIFKDSPLLFEPGERFSYSSYAWNLTSAVVERAAGEDYLSYMDKVVFGPIGMENTVADHFDSLIENRGRYYRVLEDKSAINAPFVDNSYKWAGGGFLSTSEDLVKYGFANMYATYLKPETIGLLQTSQKTNAGENTGYGIGWFVSDDPVKMVGHGGGSIGGVTAFATFPDQELVIVVISNISNGRVQTLAEQLRDYLLANLD